MEVDRGRNKEKNRGRDEGVKITRGKRKKGESRKKGGKVTWK